MKTLKIKPSSPDQGEFVVINQDDFNPNIHQLHESEDSTNVGQITVTLNTEIAPELQQAIDDAKAECEKVVAENAELIEQLKKEREAVKKLTFENTELLDKVHIAEKTLVEADAEITALKATPKKPTAAELKAAKAAEEAEKSAQPQE